MAKAKKQKTVGFPKKCINFVYKAIIELILLYFIVVSHIMGILFYFILKRIMKINGDDNITETISTVNEGKVEPAEEKTKFENSTDIPPKITRASARQAARAAAKIAASILKAKKSVLLQLYGEIDAMGLALHFAYNNIMFKNILPLDEFNLKNADHECRMQTLMKRWPAVNFPNNIISFEDADNFSKLMIAKMNEFQQNFDEWEKLNGADKDGKFSMLFWYGRINYVLSCFQEDQESRLVHSQKSLKFWNKLFAEYFTHHQLLQYHRNVDDEKILAFNILICYNSSNFEQIIKSKEESIMPLQASHPNVSVVIKSLNSLRHKYIGQMKTALFFDKMRPGEMTEVNLESFPGKIVLQLRCIVENDMVMQQRILHSSTLFVSSQFFDGLAENNQDLITMIDQYPFIRQFRH